MLLKLWLLLQGKKVYITAFATILYAALGLALHHLSWNEAMPYIFAGLGAIGFRSALKKI
jgi:hypothetical protein